MTSEAAPSIQIEAVEYSDNVDESLLQNGGSNETDVAGIIEQKKRELEKLVQDIHSLEISSPASKSPGSKFRSTIPLPEDLYQRVLTLEKDLKEKDDHVELLIHERKALEKVTRKQEQAILDLTRDLNDTKHIVLQQQYDLKLKSDEHKTLFSEQLSLYENNMQNSQSVKSVEESNRKYGKDHYPKDLYYEMMKFENEVIDRDRIVSELKAENKTLEKMLQQREADYVSLLKQAESRQDVTAMHTIALLENKATDLQNVIRDLTEENKMLLTIQAAKTKAIEELTLELQTRGATDEYVEQLKREGQTKDSEIGELIDENRKLLRIAEQREELITKLRKEDYGIPFNLWQEERKLLKAEVKKLQEVKVNSDKTLTKQKERIRQLNDRITLINKALTQTTGSPAKIPKAPIINSSSTRKGSTFSSPSKRTVSASATSSPIKMAELRSGESSLNTTTQDIDNDLEMDKEEFVPVALYEALEKSVLKLSSSVNAKDNSLAEKDEVIEILEKKLEILQKARSSDVKVSKKKELDLKDQVTALQERLEFIEEEYREREQQLRQEIKRLEEYESH